MDPKANYLRRVSRLHPNPESKQKSTQMTVDTTDGISNLGGVDDLPIKMDSWHGLPECTVLASHEIQAAVQVNNYSPSPPTFVTCHYSDL